MYDKNIFSDIQKSNFRNRIPWNKGRKGVQIAWNKDSCPVNHEFFKTNTNEMYYILGLWFADGCITLSGKKKVKLSIIGFNERDKELLYKIANIMNFRKKIDIRRHPKYNSYFYRMLIYSEKIFDDLNSFGCTRNKSLTMKFPAIPLNKLPHFIRGYFDGDGCIYKYKSENKYIVSFTSGSIDFLNSLGHLLIKEINISISRVYNKKNSNCYFSRIQNRNSVIKFGNWIYKDSSVFMKRKHTKFLEILT